MTTLWSTSNGISKIVKSEKPPVWLRKRCANSPYMRWSIQIEVERSKPRPTHRLLVGCSFSIIRDTSVINHINLGLLFEINGNNFLGPLVTLNLRHLCRCSNK
ncbi:hypothetical protein CDAR_52701 [Caerostris darwini]|uniref:Uncharacterized protein n=1 Tax=Caerostris darwini TaxID=1538125 RepID=A0AAV4T1M0_9ARAC|nr:hypothetical protein CDAR_52701 [Caerostris darwini]